MNEEQANITIMEHELQEQERGLFQMEEELFERELEFGESEQSLQQKHRQLLAFAGYVREEEASLVRRAESLGPAALAQVNSLLSDAESPALPDLGDVPDSASRMALLERRRDAYALRLEILDAREHLLALRAEAIELILGSASDIEAALLARQQLLGDAARQIFMSGGAEGVRTSRLNTAPAPMPRSPVSRTPTAPENDAPPEHARGFSAGSEAEEAQRQQKPRNRVNQVRVTLEGQLDTPGASTFFVDGEHLDGDLPGFFLATPNLLKVGREVRIRVMRSGSRIEVGGRVEWVREKGRPEGPPGMGIQFFDVGDAERERLTSWSLELPPVSIETLNSN